MADDVNPVSINRILNDSFDLVYRQLAVELVGSDGTNLQRITTDPGGNLYSSNVPYNYKVTEDGSVSYIGKAPCGTAQNEAKWQAFKMDSSSGLIITWADGDSNFDNVATDLTGLDYS